MLEFALSDNDAVGHYNNEALAMLAQPFCGVLWCPQ
jgi:hypothetical protein